MTMTRDKIEELKAYAQTCDSLTESCFMSAQRLLSLLALAERALEPQEGQEISVDVSTGEHDALRRVFARLTGDTASDGTWLAEKTGDNFAHYPEPQGKALPVAWQCRDTTIPNAKWEICDKRDTTEGDKPWLEFRALYASQLALPAGPVPESDRDPDNCEAYCPHCGGSGEEEAGLDSGGPDAKTVIVNCTHCLGSGLLINAYNSLVDQLKEANKRYLDACGKLYFANHSSSPAVAQPVADEREGGAQ